MSIGANISHSTAPGGEENMGRPAGEGVLTH